MHESICLLGMHRIAQLPAALFPLSMQLLPFKPCMISSALHDICLFSKIVVIKTSQMQEILAIICEVTSDIQKKTLMKLSAFAFS